MEAKMRFFLAALLFMGTAFSQAVPSGVIFSPGSVSTPTDTPSGGGCTGSSPTWTCTGTTSVSLSTTPAGSFYCYTTDGTTTPAGSLTSGGTDVTCSAGTKYTTP